jgi:hypothetical protein
MLDAKETDVGARGLLSHMASPDEWNSGTADSKLADLVGQARSSGLNAAARPSVRSLSGVVHAWARPKYRHVISLGYFCATAHELQRYGLRDGSYPLDWNISPIGSVLAMMESGFNGFLQLDNLHLEPRRVCDTGSGILVYNDFDPARPIAEQYEVVRKRYARRITRFRRAIARRTLFVRYMENLEEFAYLDEHMVAVLAVLRRTNPLNDLLLVGNSDLPATCGGLHVYTVVPDEGDVVARKFLRKNPQLRRSLIGLGYPLGLRAWNLLRYWWSARRRLRLRTRLRSLRGHLCP